MAYVTDAEIETRLGAATLVQLADDDGDGVADADVVEEARLSAEAIVNSFLSRRYRVPVDLMVYPEVANMLRSVTLDLAEFRLRARRPPVAADIMRLHEQAMIWLMRVAEGGVQLPAPSALAGPVGNGTVAAVTGAQRRLTDGELSAI